MKMLALGLGLFGYFMLGYALAALADFYIFEPRRMRAARIKRRVDSIR